MIVEMYTDKYGFTEFCGDLQAVSDRLEQLQKHALEQAAKNGSLTAWWVLNHPATA